MAAVGIVAALATEAKILGNAVRTESSGSLRRLTDGTLVAISGMGTQSAVRAARTLGAAGAVGLVSWGVAGGLDPRLRAGDLILPNLVAGPDGASVEPSAVWRATVVEQLAGRMPITAGTLLTTPEALASVAAKATAFRSSGAVAVDMESLAVGQTALALGLPFLAVRVIVDGAQDLLPAAVMTASRGGEVHIGRLLCALLVGPRDLAPLVRLAGRYRAATRTLAQVAAMGWRLPTRAGRTGT